MKTSQATQVNAIIQHGIDNLSNVGADGTYGCDLHNKLYNEDYFIIGTYDAKKFLEEYGTFDAIEKVMTYEKEQFGETTTAVHDPEKLVNMLAYVHGEEALNTCSTLHDKWDVLLTAEDIEAIKSELEAQL